MSLTSNGVPIPFQPEFFAPMRDVICAEGGKEWVGMDRDEVRARYLEDGYLLVRGLIPRSLVLSARAKYFSLFPSEMFEAGTEKGQGVFSGKKPELPQHGTPGHPAYEAVRSDWFEQVASYEGLFEVARLLLGERDVAQLRRRPLRSFFTGNLSSRAHVDGTYLGGAAESIVTGWVPIGDCPVSRGGLVYLKGSHKLSETKLRELVGSRRDRPDDPRPLTNDLRSLSEATGMPWLYEDFGAGDVVFHTASIVHASLDCRSRIIRVSTDLRFQPSCMPVDSRWREDWSGNDGA